MSRKTELRADLHRIGYQLGGAHLTQQARGVTFRTFARVMREKDYGIRSAQQVSGRHLRAYVEHRLADGISKRTIANEVGHMRAVLIRCGKEGLARNPEYDNKALGIVGGSRIGTKQPLSDETIRDFREKMDGLHRPGIGITVELQRAFGLRETEAIRAGQADTLDRWERELRERGYVRVVEGTKGGRPRDVHPVDLGRAQTVVLLARETLSASGLRHLVTRVGGTPAAGLRQAITIYRNLCSRAGIQNHGARYAFARERMQGYRNEGLSEREARAATSLDLGHGDGRGRYVFTVYASNR